MTKGTRVTTPLGPGTVVYVRMDHLGDINDIAAVSVLLDSRRDAALRGTYSGTIFPRADVTELAGFSQTTS